MALWPFGRKKKVVDKSNEREKVSQSPSNILKKNPTAQSTKADIPESTRSDPGPNHANAPKYSRRLLSRNERSRSVSAASKPPSTRTKDQENRDDIPPVPSIPPSKAEQPTDQFDEKSPPPSLPPSRQPLAEVTNPEEGPHYYHHQPTTSQLSLQPERFTVAPNYPTLRPTKSAAEGNVSRAKSSKRKEEDRARAQVIKSMSSPIPVPKRPRSHQPGPLARESRTIAGGLNRHFDRPASQVSLPLPESLHSSRSSISDMHGFKISAFDALSPRPTIKYTENPRFQAGASLGPSRSSTRKDKAQIIPEESFNSKDRIDDLADDLDASGLRELLERDKRRRERKRKSNHAELQRKLQRKSEQQRAEEQSGEAPNPSNVEEHSLPIEIPSPVNGSPVVRPVKETKRKPSWLDDPSKEHLPENPFKDHESYLEEASLNEKEDPVLGTATAIRLSQTSLSPPTSPVQKTAPGPSHLSTVSDIGSQSNPDLPDLLPPDPSRLQPEEPRRDSDTSGRVVGSWTSIFRRSGQKSKRNSVDPGRGTPSEFSNTSRDSLTRQLPIPRPAPARNFKPKTGTGAPARTQSKFKEDLPELPISPPASRLQSPELRASSPYIDRASKIETAAGGLAAAAPLSDVHPAYRDEVAQSRGQSLRGPSPEVPSPNVLSQSLASVDSEGSWLSGRPAKRSSTPMNPLRSSAGSLSQHFQEDQENAEPYFARRDPAAGPSRGTSGLSSQLKPDATAAADESDDDPSPHSEEAVKLNAVVGRHPTIIRHSNRDKSREGLLDDFLEDDSVISNPDESPIEPQSQHTPIEKGSVHRATSVEYRTKGHAKHISAGSARLLDVTPRTSREHKRLSTGSVAASMDKSPLAVSEAEEDD